MKTWIREMVELVDARRREGFPLLKALAQALKDRRRRRRARKGSR